MPRPRFAKLDPAKKEAILTAALEAFASHGFDGASYNQIIEKAGISKGAMYYYFDDKEDLFATVVRHELEDILQHFHTLPEVSTPDFVQATFVKTNDQALVVYLAAMIRSVIALHNLINRFYSLNSLFLRYFFALFGSTFFWFSLFSRFCNSLSHYLHLEIKSSGLYPPISNAAFLANE